MATLANGWYKGKLPCSEITEIVISSGTTRRYAESWDASESQDGSIMCYRGGTKVSIVCDSVTEIKYKAFSKFLALKKISGLGNVSTIGGYAFCYTPNLVSVDLVPANITSIGDSAFRMSNIEDVIDLSQVSGSVGNFATRSERWGTDLNAVRSIAFPKTIYLDVPNSENQDNYPDVLFSDYDGAKLSVATAGCTALTMYHIWNYIHAGTSKEYNNWLDWFNSTLNKDGNFAENNAMLLESEETWIESLGWTPSANEKVSSATHLQTIVDRLAIGYPTYITIHSVNNDGGLHTLAIIGCDAKTHKLAVIDSHVSGTSGVVAWLAFEDIFVGGTEDTDRIRVIDYNLPVLAPNSTWFTQGNSAANKATITEVRIKDTYTPTGTPNFSWDASASKDGSVMAYIEGSVLTLAGDGHGKISMNADSANFFNGFGSMTKVDGGSYLDTSRVTSFERMFQACFALEHLDVSTWNTSNATTLKAMYQGCKLINKLDVSKWNTSNVTDISYFLNMPAAQYANSNLIKLDVSNWDVAKVTNMKQFTNLCYVLDGLDVSKWDTSSCTDMTGMFYKCSSISVLDLSNWNTAKVTTFTNMLAELNNLRYLKLGSEFGGTSKSNLTAPSAAYIPNADGNWYDVNGDANAPSSIPNNTYGIWYASKFLADEDANSMVLVKKGNLLRTALAIRTKGGTTKGYTPAEFADAVLQIQ